VGRGSEVRRPRDGRWRRAWSGSGSIQPVGTHWRALSCPSGENLLRRRHRAESPRAAPAHCSHDMIAAACSQGAPSSRSPPATTGSVAAVAERVTSWAPLRRLASTRNKTWEWSATARLVRVM
jgi:hypothetical protein